MNKHPSMYALALTYFVCLLLPLSCGEIKPMPDDLKVIYGRDDRRDVYSYPFGSAIRDWAQSVALVIEHRYLDFDPATGYSFPYQKSFAEKMIALGQPLCSAEPFQDQPLLGGFCSAFLIAPNRLATASHCVDRRSCMDVAFVFNTGKDSPNHNPHQISNEHVYFCKKVITSHHDLDGSDYAVIELDRPATGRSPLPLRRSGQLDRNENLVLIGNPLGMPTKISTEGRVLSNNSTHAFFLASTDSYAGASGSPVIGKSSGVVEGVLARGETDFVQQGSCWTSKVCPENGDNCRGEDIVRASHLLPYTLNH